MRTCTLIVVLALSCVGVSGCTVDEPPPRAEDTVLGSQLDPLNKARNFQSEYNDALDQKREDLDREIDR